MPEFSRQSLVTAMTQVFVAAGAPADIATKMSSWLANANISGHPSHGMIRIPDYAGRHIREGLLDPSARPVIKAESDGIVLFDGCNGFGHLAAEALTLQLAVKARENGIAAGGIVNVTHIGRLGEWAELAVRQGVMLFMCVGWSQGSDAAPHGAKEALLGTNPIAFGAPGIEDSMILDFATTASAEGKVRHHRDQGIPVPAGWLLDRDGKPTTNPADLYSGGMMLPFGGHKGYGLAIMVALLGGALVGSGSGEKGTFAFAIDPGAFGNADATLETASHVFERMRGARALEEGNPVQIPGDYERNSRSAASDTILLPDETWKTILETAESLGLSAEQITAEATS